MSKHITYSLVGDQKGSGNFYNESRAFTDSILHGIDLPTDRYIRDFSSFINESKNEHLRSYDEYVVEYLLTQNIFANHFKIIKNYS